MNVIEKIYLICASFLFAVMVGIFWRLLIDKDKTSPAFIFPVGVGMITIPVYSLFVFSNSYKMAMFFDGLYFLCTVWLCFSMLVFAIFYCEVKFESKFVLLIPIAICTLDSVMLIANTWTKSAFDLVRSESVGKITYWNCQFKWLNYMHFGWSYFMLVVALALLLHNSIKSAWSYKRKYVLILVSLAFGVLANMASYALNWVIDFSVLFYPLLAAFIYYHSFYDIPQHILSSTLKNVNESFDDAILFFDTRGKCIYKNSKAKKLFSTDGKFNEDVSHQYLAKTRNKQSGSDSPSAPIEFFIIDGEERQFEAQMEDIYFGYNLVGAYLKLTDKTEEIKKFLSQRYLATHDELTGLYNREHFFEVCDETLEKNPNTEYIMFSSNIIQFKLVNELFGEKTGDKVLVALANIAKEKIRDGIIGRINDDKFCCLVQKNYFQQSWLKDIKMAIQKVVEDSAHKINLRAGLCNVLGSGESAQQIYDKTQLVINKLGDDYHKNVDWYNSDLMDQLLRERRITNEFEDALEHGRISMYLQPFVDSEKNISGGEALARWNHPKYGVMNPEDFVPVLERSGLAHKLDTFIWRQAAKTLAEWQQKKVIKMQISVNVSSKDIFYIDIAKEFDTLLKEYLFNPVNLKIEFTESSVSANTKRAESVFENLRALGFEIGINEFGHGYSSLNMLKDINVDILKMDMVLIQNNENPERTKVILNFISQVSHALGMRLISEGVETSEQLEMLKKLGCEYFQGFYFSHPLTVGDFEDRYLGNKEMSISGLF